MKIPRIGFLDKLLQRWQLTSYWQLVVILIVFSVTGWTVKEIKDPIFYLFGVTAATSFWKKALIWLFTIFPLYYVLILIYGWLFGQFDFFYRMVQKSIGRFGKLYAKMKGRE